MKRHIQKVAVRELNIEELKDDIRIPEEYRRALLVFRFHGRVIGKAIFLVHDGNISLTDIRDFIPSISKEAWEALAWDSAPLADNEPFVSVVVCTHDRTADLKYCLKSLQNLNYKNKEIIVIDNCPSSINTYKLVAQFQGVQYILEPSKGLDIARNTGLKRAKGEIVAFTDDDARVDQMWLKNLVKSFSHPLVAIVTGITMPAELETFPQIYFEETNGFNRGFYRKEFDFTNLNPIASGRVGAGVNMAIRKSHLKDIGLFDEALDGGMPTCSGGDQEFFFRCLIRGYRIVYDPSILVWHKHRNDIKSLENTIYGYGVGVFAWWTRALVVEKEYKLLLTAPVWFLRYYLLNLLKAVFFIKGSTAIKLAYLELKGSLEGPYRYISTVRKLQRNRVPGFEIQTSGSPQPVPEGE